MHIARLLLLACLALALGACIDPTVKVRRNAGASVPVKGSDAHAGEVYRVAAGDTLYGIAFRYKLDFRELARLNQIREPYTIYPQQALQLAPPRPVVSVVAPRVPSARVPTATTSSPPSAGSTAPATVALPALTLPPEAVELPPTRVVSVTPARDPSLPAGFMAEATTPAVITPLDSGGARVVAPTANPSRPANLAQAELALVAPPIPNTPPKAGSNGWGWPVRGRLLATFAASNPMRQGIDISGSPGQPVHAAASGEVVYSGRGIIGYGELIVIKHNDSTLSAYGHNKRRLVREGQRVKQGEQVAELGKDMQGRDLLHFEVRRNGKPIDPLGVLPRQ